MAMKRPVGGEAGPTKASALDEVLKGWLPTLHDHLTETVWEDGKTRKTTTVMLVVEGGYWKAWIHDRDAKRSAWVTGEAWEALWQRVEEKLASDDLEWRKDTR